MGRLSRAAGWGAARLCPVEYREWAEAIWAEADQIPSALGRLNWYVGGAWLLAKEPIVVRRVANAALFAAGTVLIAVAAWHGTISTVQTNVIRLLAITTIGALVMLPRFIRRRLGKVIDSRLARTLRSGTYLAIVAMIIALTNLTRLSTTASRLASLGPYNQPSVGLFLPWSIFLLALTFYVAMILAVTAQRSWVRPQTLAIGTIGGAVLGGSMYAIMPLGFGQRATAPWLPGSGIDPVVVLAWLLLVCGPVAAALAAGRFYRASAGPFPLNEGKIRQGVAAGTLVTVIGSLLVCVLGPVTMAAMPHAWWLAQLMRHGHHATAVAVNNRAYVLYSNGGAGYMLIWLIFPFIGLGVASWTAVCAWSESARRHGNGPGGGGNGDGPEPEPGPGGQQADDEVSSVAVGLIVATRVS